MCTYRPAADRQRSGGSRTGGRAEVIQRTREECCRKDRSGKNFIKCRLEKKKQKKNTVPFIYREAIVVSGGKS